MVDFAALEAFIERAHRGQTDKAGRPYHLHPKRVRRILLDLFPDATEAEQAAALTHDVLEDTHCDAAALRAAGVPPEAIEIVRIVSRQPDADGNKPSYPDFIRTIVASGNPGAWRVKIADLTDNADETRLATLPEDERDKARRRIAERYRPALDLLWRAVRRPRDRHPWAGPFDRP